MKEHQCLECHRDISNPIYAIYASNVKTQADNEPLIIGYICDDCSRKHKVKPLKQNNDFLNKLEKLKEQLNEN